ncbi:MAG TPA: class I SAM-dependent methyltransferase [candidate division Zixibacteria bacterium]|nr:class I SAM-dependent methyltransferase [candidate division Zixibacteria bacterium]
MSTKAHWERLYENTAPEKLGWYEPHLQTSLGWIRELGLDSSAPIIDVGGGASTLVDDLRQASYSAVTVVDLSAKALALAKARLGERADAVTWLEGDITAMDLPAGYYALWHDRAVFHCLTHPDAAPVCSGLPVRRYGADELKGEMGSELELERHVREVHRTPAGVAQSYLYCLFGREG